MLDPTSPLSCSIMPKIKINAASRIGNEASVFASESAMPGRRHDGWLFDSSAIPSPAITAEK
ncbi:hypothetical protein D3C81_2272130 [compost metagenome]